MKDKDPETFDTKTVIIIVLLIVIAGLIFNSSPPLPKNCHRTPSTDVGGGEIECD